MNVNSRLRVARIEAGLSQKELAERLHVYQKDISRWENGERTPSLSMFTKICRELCISSDVILGLEK